MHRRTLTIAEMTGVAACLLLAACERGSSGTGSGGTAPSKPAGTTSVTVGGAGGGADDANLAADFIRSESRPPTSPVPPGHPPLSGSITTPGPAVATGLAPMLKFDAPADWISERADRPLRRGQYRIPRDAADAEDGELAIFDNQITGSVDDNIQRWVASMTTPDGRPMTADQARIDRFDSAGGLRVTLLDASGRYSPTMMPGAAASFKEGYRLLGAVVETPDGLWFFKAAGPEATMARHREAFVGMLRSLRP